MTTLQTKIGNKLIVFILIFMFLPCRVVGLSYLSKPFFSCYFYLRRRLKYLAGAKSPRFHIRLPVGHSDSSKNIKCPFVKLFIQRKLKIAFFLRLTLDINKIIVRKFKQENNFFQ